MSRRGGYQEDQGDQGDQAESRLYVAQREALIGFDDSDRGIRAEEIFAMAGRWGIPGVVIDIDPTAPTGQAFAYPGLQLLLFHPVAMVRWIAAHEVAHLVVGPMQGTDTPHGPLFVRCLLEIIRAECGADAATRLRTSLGDAGVGAGAALVAER